MANMVGTMLGKYKLVERLGKGGMAEVYKAYHEKLDRQVTIKILHTFLADGEEFLARFEREAKAIASLRHPHIVQIYDFERQDDIYYMVMEFIDGETLQARMASLVNNGQYIPIAELKSIISQMSKALDYAHQRGIIHRDVKPSNVLLNTARSAFLTDFGIARIMSASQFTATGSLIGTPSYMSPEQGKGVDLDKTTDIYSLGIVLFEMLTGKVPFHSDTPLAIIHKQIHDPLPRPSELRPAIPASLEMIIYKAVEKEPEDRYQSASELYQALDEALTPEVISKLEEWASGETMPVSGMPTLLDDDTHRETRSEMETEVMGEKTVAEITAKSAVTKTTVASSSPVETFEGPGEATKPSSKGEEKPKAKPKAGKIKFPALPGWLKTRTAILSIIGVAALAVLAVILSNTNTSNGVTCSSPEECWELSMSYREDGDLDEALNLVDAAIDEVPDPQHAAYAWIWCERGMLLQEMGRDNEVAASQDKCVAWESESGSCTSVPICLTLMTEYREKEDFEQALFYIEKALEYVPENEHAENAWMWCDRGDFLNALNRPEEAEESYHICEEWRN